jgi:hypothetical protein
MSDTPEDPIKLDDQPSEKTPGEIYDKKREDREAALKALSQAGYPHADDLLTVLDSHEELVQVILDDIIVLSQAVHALRQEIIGIGTAVSAVSTVLCKKDIVSSDELLGVLRELTEEEPEEPSKPGPEYSTQY